jgi:antitoxin component YwqK of YwqJK toxin-antitoxin module
VAPTPDQLAFWRDGVKACERVGKLYEYEDAFGCGIEPSREGEPTLSIGFDGQGRLTQISRFARTADGESKLEGPFLEVYPGGGVRSKMTYHGGLADGQVQHFHPNGQLSLEGAYVADRADGEFRTWDGRGQPLASFEMRGGTGKWREWHGNGARALETSYVDGQEHGAHLEWFEDGKPAREAHFEAGQPVGVEKVWSAPGKKASEGQYAKGRRVGTWRFYDAAGVLERLDVFDDDSRVSTAPHQGGKPVGALGAPGKCATDEGLERELRAQRGLEVSHLCVKRPELYPGVIVLGEFAHDYGCAHPVAYADCNLRTPLSGTQLLARAGWKAARPELRRRLARAFVEDIALAWARADEQEVETLADGALIFRASISSPVGMREDAPSSSTDFLCRVTAPGYIGTTQYCFLVALRPFGVSDEIAFAGSLYALLLGLIPVTLAGLFYAARLGLKLRTLREEAERTGEPGTGN